MFGVLKPCKGGTPIPLMKPKILVGRKSFCDVTIPFPNVSARHSELELKDGYWYVRDLESTNGTFVDGKSIETHCIRPDSILSIGRHRFTLVYEAKGDPPQVEQSLEEVTSESLLSKAGVTPEQPKTVEQPAGSRGQLFPVGGGSPIALKGNQVVVGRDRGCDMFLQSNKVSARHCELEFTEGHWVVHDLGSRNGIKVDGKQVQHSLLLPGCLLQIADLRFKVLYVPTPGILPPKDIGVSLARGLLEKAGLLRRR